MDVISLLLLLVALVCFGIAAFAAHRLPPVPSWGWVGALALALMLLVERVWA